LLYVRYVCKNTYVYANVSKKDNMFYFPMCKNTYWKIEHIVFFRNVSIFLVIESIEKCKSR